MYTFKNTEITNKKSSDYETKSMLYLMGMHPDSKKVDIVVVDCFNDVTGVDDNFTLMLDVQSKNYSTFNPSLIGQSLYTLFDNYVSEFKFHDYILFSQPLNPSYLYNSDLRSFDYSNIKDKTKFRIEKKLREIIIKNHGGVDEVKLSQFLDKVTFFNDDRSCSHYIKKLSGFKSKSYINDITYENIFKEIRDKQSSLKNSEIENETISTPKEVLRLDRYITKSQINSLIISRIIGVTDIFKGNGIPFAFLSVINEKGLSKDKDLLKDTIQECNSNLSRTLFDKGTSKKFWQLSEAIIKMVRTSKSDCVYELYDELLVKVKKMPPHMDKITTQYLISLVLQGMEYDY
ncbi:hypothetical protein [Vibrio nitrifigilis]|uniref:CD-NTase associated protein 4-like DNA endonuclease domain-containing protein n=1 Tax=Vibrio nitrifigilis TaxID=2789781 RepID=A0ABS0GC92_9VIBR|nr:hypothetical protein [Vibrio nitrifigilis]MBF9000033.1 hypothetical protein [Vibrio nitrifigilis]